MTIPDPVEPAPAPGPRPHDEGQDAVLAAHDRLLDGEERELARLRLDVDNRMRRVAALEGASR